MTYDEHDYHEIEARLRAVAPAIRPGVRERILHDCAQRQRQSVRARQVTRWRLAGALAGICITEWLTANGLDSQRVQLLAGRQEAAPAPITLVAGAPDSVSTTLRLRSRTLAQLMDSPDFIAFSVAKEASNVQPTSISPTSNGKRNG